MTSSPSGGEGVAIASVAPPIHFLFGRHTRRRSGKACGEDTLAPEFYRVAPATTALLDYAAAARAAWRLESPLAWRGSFIHAIYKGKGDPFQCDSSRDVAVASLPPKDFHAWLRSLLIGPLSKLAKDTQCGGLNHRGTDLMAHISRAHWQYVRQEALSGSQLYVDLRAAFASVLRQLAFVPPDSDFQVAHTLKLFGMPSSDGGCGASRLVGGPAGP